MSEKLADLIEMGLDNFNSKKENQRKRRIKEAVVLGIQPEPDRTTLSDYKLGMLETCPYLYRVGGELSLSPKKKDPNRSYGSAVHDGFELLAKGSPLDEAITAFGKSWRKRLAKIPDEDFIGKRFTADELLAMGPKALLLLRRELEGSEIVEGSVEHWLDWTPIKNPRTGDTISGFVFAGKCDLIRQKPGDPGPVVEDLKNLATITKEAERITRTALTPQLTIYCEMVRGDSLLGEIEGIGRYASRLEVNKAKTVLKIGRFPVREITIEDRERLFMRARDAAMRILTYRKAEADGAPLDMAWPKFDSACFGKYGVCDNAPLCYPHLFPNVDLAEDFGLKVWD